MDWLTAGYNAILAVVWATLLARAPFAGWLFAAHAAAAAMPWLLARGDSSLTRPVRVLREAYPLLWLLPLWTELDFLRGLLHTTANDAPIAGLESAIFGFDVSAVWMPSMPEVWFSEVMHLLYFAYYPAIILPLLFVAFSGRVPALRDMGFGLMLTYLTCYLIYIVFPVDGPHFLLQNYQGPLTDGFFYGLVRGLQGAGDSMGCAFPSSHVAGTTTMAFLAWRWFRPPIAWLLTAAAIGVAFASVYTQNHYAVDSIAGVVWALGLQVFVAPVLLRGLRSWPLANNER